MERLVFFETLTSWHRPLVAWYLARGARVHVFDFTYRLKRIGWLRRLLLEGRVERIYIHNGSRADGLAIEAAEWAFAQAARHPLVKRLEGIFGAGEAAAPFKFALVQWLGRYFYIRLHLERLLHEKRSVAQVILIPEAYARWDDRLRQWCQGKIAPVEGVRIPRWAHAWSIAVGECQKAALHLPRYAASAARAGWIAAKRWWGGRPGETPQETIRARYLFAIDSKFLAGLTGIRRFDFLLDHERMTKENTAFLVGKVGDGRWVEQARKEGYRILRWAEHAGGEGTPPRFLAAGEVMRGAIEGMLRIGAPDWLHEAAAMGLWVYVKEGGLWSRLRFQHYIYANLYGLLPRWRNALVRKAGGQSWWYAYSSGGPYTRAEGGPFASDEDFGGPLKLWACENADHFVSPCRPLIDYHRRHRQQIRQYHDVGSIWSEQIIKIGGGVDRDAVLRDWFGPPADGRKVIAWFDTTFAEAPNSPSTFTEAIQWYQDILRLAEEQPDLRMVIKPHKDEGYYVSEEPDRQWSTPRIGKGLLRAWEELKAHPRVRFLDRQTDPSLVIAVSDLTVTFPYTSLSAEAIGARRRAIWYEPGQRWRNTLYARVPGLVAHGYPELLALVRKLLWETSGEEYDRFLEEKARGLIETFLDGKGISRFRALLAGKEADALPESTRVGLATVSIPEGRAR